MGPTCRSVAERRWSCLRLPGRTFSVGVVIRTVCAVLRSIYFGLEAAVSESVPSTMTAAVVHQCGDTLSVEQRRTPHPRRGQALVKVFALGVCHTDLHASAGDWPVKPSPPFVPGHEGSGEVIPVGADGKGVGVGD